MTERQSQRITRRGFLAGAVGGALVGNLAGPAFRALGAPEPEIEPLETDDATVTSLDVTPDVATVSEYTGFELTAEVKTGTEADNYLLPTIYILDVAESTVLPQQPAKTYEPGVTDTYEMGFVAPDVEKATTVVVHMDGHYEEVEVSA